MDQPVLPVPGVLVPLPLGGALGQAVEVEAELPLAAVVGPAQLLHQQRGGHLLAGVQRRAREVVAGVRRQVAVQPGGGALTVPGQQRVGAQVAVEVHVGALDRGLVGGGHRLGQPPRDAEGLRRPVAVGHQRRRLRGRLVGSACRGVIVGARLVGLGSRHGASRSWRGLWFGQPARPGVAGCGLAGVGCRLSVAAGVLTARPGRGRRGARAGARTRRPSRRPSGAAPRAAARCPPSPGSSARWSRPPRRGPCRRRRPCTR